ncbi:hypothetical protein ABHN03_03800 [Paenibacillus sp. NRS-1775]|uniref:hypothetical protein n=1 Tax=unclassified Paenibacillus TaxID=185978 RepID=UPI003D28BA82
MKEQWTFNDIEHWDGEIEECFDTRTEAIEAGKKYFGFKNYYGDEDKTGFYDFYIGQTFEVLNDIRINLEKVLDDISTFLYNRVSDSAIDYLNDVKPEDRKVLDLRLTQVVHEWIKEFGYEPKFFKIGNIEKIEMN